MRATAGRTILIVDDDEDLGRLVCKFLILQGYTVHVCATGQLARAAVREHHPDCILVDLNLQDTYGLDLAPELFALNPGAHVRIFLFTAAIAPPTHDQLPAGVCGVIRKPFELEDLLFQLTGT
jgi:DNA-binding response OmpR family regulator